MVNEIKVGDIKGESLSAHRWYAVQDKQPLVKLVSKLKTSPNLIKISPFIS